MNTIKLYHALYLVLYMGKFVFLIVWIYIFPSITLKLDILMKYTDRVYFDISDTFYLTGTRANPLAEATCVIRFVYKVLLYK